jgi:hypothetical protein
MNGDIPIYSIILLKIIGVVQVMFGLALTFIGSFFMTGLLPHFDLGISLGYLIIICLGMFTFYAGVHSLWARLSVFNWVLNCVLLTVYGAFFAYHDLFIFYSSVALLGMVGVILRGKYEKYQLRKSLQDFPD